MRFLKQSTNVHVLIGVLTDYQDGVTPKTSLTLANADCDLIKGVTKTDITLAGSGDNQFTHVANGYWELDLTTGNTDTLGQLIITLRDDDVFVPLWAEFQVLPANVYDSLFSTDRLQVDVREYGDANLALTTQMKADVNAECDTAVVGTALSSPTAGSIGDLVLRLRKINTNKWRVDEAASPPQLLIYDDNGSSVLYTFNLYASDGATGAHQNIYERHPV